MASPLSSIPGEMPFGCGGVGSEDPPGPGQPDALVPV